MRLIICITAALLLGACAMKNESFVNQEPLRLKNETVEAQFVTSQISKGQLNDLADDIKHRANSPVTVTVQYELKPPLKNSQRLAEAQGARVKSYLQKQGVRHPVYVTLAPVDVGQSSNTLTIHYEALKALGPKDCKHIGLADSDEFSHAHDSGYRYGCTQDGYLSAMIAHPEDLLGNDTVAATDSQRLGRSQDVYRSGERATDPADEGLSASNVYSGQ